jgi:hypothetical protein
MDLLELVVVGGVGDGSEMKDGVEPFLSELFAPIEFGQVLCHEIAPVAGQVFEIAGAKIIDHSETRLGESFLQSKGKIGADKTGPAGDDEVEWRVRRGHGKEVLVG